MGFYAGRSGLERELLLAGNSRHDHRLKPRGLDLSHSPDQHNAGGYRGKWPIPPNPSAQPSSDAVACVRIVCSPELMDSGHTELPICMMRSARFCDFPWSFSAFADFQVLVLQVDGKPGCD